MVDQFLSWIVILQSGFVWGLPYLHEWILVWSNGTFFPARILKGGICEETASVKVTLRLIIDFFLIWKKLYLEKIWMGEGWTVNLNGIKEKDRTLFLG